jgi:hypothetical protein
MTPRKIIHTFLSRAEDPLSLREIVSGVAEVSKGVSVTTAQIVRFLEQVSEGLDVKFGWALRTSSAAGVTRFKLVKVISDREGWERE